MMTMNRYLIHSALIAALLAASAPVMAKGEPMYHFLPSDTVVNNVKTSLQNQGIDISAVQVDADAEGVVQLRGEVSSKQDAEAVTKLAKQSEGVYAVLGSLRYETGEVVAAPAPAGLDPMMEAPAAGTEPMDAPAAGNTPTDPQ